MTEYDLTTSTTLEELVYRVECLEILFTELKALLLTTRGTA